MVEPPALSRLDLEAMIEHVFPDLPIEERRAVEHAWRLLARWVERLPRDQPMGEEPAHLFVPPEPSA